MIAYLGGDAGWQAWSWIGENKVPVVAAVSSMRRHPGIKNLPRATFSFAAIAGGPKISLGD